MKLSKKEIDVLSNAIKHYMPYATCEASDFCEGFKIKMHIVIFLCNDCKHLRNLLIEAQANVENSYVEMFTRAVDILQKVAMHCAD